MGRFLFQHEHERTTIMMKDLGRFFCCKGVFHRRGEIIMKWIYILIILVTIATMAYVAGSLVYGKFIGVFVWGMLYVFNLVNLVYWFLSIFIRMQRRHHYEFKRTKRSMCLQFLISLGVCCLNIYFAFWVYGFSSEYCEKKNCQ